MQENQKVTSKCLLQCKTGQIQKEAEEAREVQEGKKTKLVFKLVTKRILESKELDREKEADHRPDKDLHEF